MWIIALAGLGLAAPAPTPDLDSLSADLAHWETMLKEHGKYHLSLIHI